ncbi:MAG TPA: hypothetical protein VFA86_13200 [Gammaproteobacteria bacterium]|nr:hypothetical protein [Gammaproteobacteria bacterium]
MKSLPAVLLVSLLAGLSTGAVHAEPVLSAYAGWSGASGSDLRYAAPGGTSLTVHDVSWNTDSFEPPPYYGVRATWWLRPASGPGLALDFTHAKILLRTAETARVTGMDAGAPVDARRPVASVIPHFENTHGLNFLTLSGLYRVELRHGGPRPTWQAYAGAGAGVAYPHVEARIGQAVTFRHEWAGPVAQGLLGLETRTGRHLGFFIEYRLSRVWLDEDLATGARIRTNLWLHQVAVGGGWHF